MVYPVSQGVDLCKNARDPAPVFNTCNWHSTLSEPTRVHRGEWKKMTVGKAEKGQRGRLFFLSFSAQPSASSI